MWLWQQANGRLEAVDSGTVAPTAVVDGLELGPSSSSIVMIDDTYLVLPTVSFELPSLDDRLAGVAMAGKAQDGV